jgi:hypothetical protein
MSDTQRPTDIDLVAAYRAGDTDAFAEIYDRYSAEVFSHFLARGRSRSDAADGANATFLEASSRLDLNDSPTDLRSFLLDIAASVSGDAKAREPDEVAPAPPALRPRVLDKVEREVASAFSMRSLDPEWVKVGLFALVTLIVGLIGLGISAQFEPLSQAPAVPGTQPPVAAATTTTSSVPASSATTTAAGGGATSSTTAAAPATIETSTDTINFGSDATANELELTNSGGRPGQWEISSTSQAIAASPRQGELAGGETVTVELQLDRENVPEGDLEETITVTWSDGEHEIPVVGSHEDNPIIHNPQASPASIQVSGDPECPNTQTTVSARVRDTSALESVVVEWSPDGGAQNETAMTPVGDDMFEGVVGPFTVVGTVDLRIVAFDERGNAGGAMTQIAVVECP